MFPQLWQSRGLLSPNSEFDTSLAHVESVVERVALWQGIVHDLHFHLLLLLLLLLLLKPDFIDII